MEPIERVDWPEFMRRFTWNKGEHVTALAPTGGGKTRLFSALTPLRPWNLFFGTKVDDSSYRAMIRNHGFRRIGSIDEVTKFHQNWLLWPKPGKTNTQSFAIQRHVFEDALNKVTRQRNWAVYLDEAKYMAEQLHMKTAMTYAYEQWRSIGITAISGGQRPAFIPLSALSNATHIFLWRNNLDADANRLASISGVKPRDIINEIKTLGTYEFLYIKTRGTDVNMLRSQVKI